MLSYLVRRLLLALFTIWAISILAFVIIQLPPVDFIDTYITERMNAGGSRMAPEQIQALRAQYGADQPKPIQYLRWIGLALHGDFGFTLEYQRPVTDVIGDRLALTMVVSLAALLVTWIVALPIGIYSAVRQYSAGDYIFTLLGFLGLGLDGQKNSQVSGDQDVAALDSTVKVLVIQAQEDWMITRESWHLAHVA